MITKKMMVLIILFLLLLTGCGSTQNADDKRADQNINIVEINDRNQTLSQNEAEDNQESDQLEQNNTEDKGQAEQAGAYYVNEKYYIKPINKDDDEKVVLLTFDDSPAGDSTQAILDLLDKYNAKAVWYINGYYADKNRELLKDIHNKGHIIGNHTWWHENLKKLDPEKTRQEIVSINDLVEEVTGVRPTYFRAPFGVYSDEAKKVLKEENMQYMNWTWGSLDWELKTAEEIEKNVIDHVHNGANILFHDKRITADALENILQALTEEDYKFVLPTEVRIQD